MWLLLTVTVTCMCASPRCRSNAVSLSFSAYCQKLCLWGRGGNLCHCNAAHFVGKRRDIRQHTLGQHEQLQGHDLTSDDGEELWNDDDNALSFAGDWLDDKNSTPVDDVWTEQSDDHASSTLSRAHSHRSLRPEIFLALRRRNRRHRSAENTDQLLVDSAKKGERQEPVMDDQSSLDDRPTLMTLNVLTHKPTTPMNQWKVLRKTTSQSREFRGLSWRFAQRAKLSNICTQCRPVLVA